MICTTAVCVVDIRLSVCGSNPNEVKKFLLLIALVNVAVKVVHWSVL